jgi:ABC-2 type transport system ATP-binding protein
MKGEPEMLTVKNLVKNWNGKRAVDGLTFRLDGGEVYGLLGPNGSGKTTTFRILSGLVQPEAGEVQLDAGARAGIAAQEIAVYRDLTVKENLVFFARMQGQGRRNAAESAARILQTFSFADYSGTLAGNLSGGWQRRLHVAIALVHEPGFLILDEPTAGLDLEGRHELWETIRAVKRAGTSVLVTTHDLLEAERICDRIGVLESGRLVAEGSLEELRRLVPAVSIAVMKTENEPAIEHRATQLGLATRHYAGELAVLLQVRSSILEVAEKFRGIPVTSVAVREIGLEEVWAEVTGYSVKEKLKAAA